MFFWPLTFLQFFENMIKPIIKVINKHKIIIAGVGLGRLADLFMVDSFTGKWGLGRMEGIVLQYSLLHLITGRSLGFWSALQATLVKKTSSSVGMKNSVETSPLLKFRAEHCVPMRTREMIQAIQVWGKNKLTLTRRKHVCRVKAFFSRIRLVNLPTLTE